MANFIWLCRAGVIRVIDLLRQLNRDAPVQCSCRIPLFPTHGYAGQAKEISIWEDASENLRQCVLETARDLGLAPSDIRDIVCAVLQRRPNRRNWSEYPNVWEEAQEDVYGCQWFQVYDIIEKIWNRFKRADDRSVWDEERAPAFRQAINDFFLTNGIGWQLVKGEIVMFSRILARAITGDPQATLGEILKKHPDLLPRPLYEALSKVWGSALMEAHHLKEGQQPKREEAELLVGLTAVVATYWSKKCDRPMARWQARTVVRKG